MGCLVERFGPSSSISFLLAFVFLIFRRYNVQAAVVFSWKDLEGGSQEGADTTRDISTQAGLCVTSAAATRTDSNGSGR